MNDAVTNVLLGVLLALVAWYFVGRNVNRRRAFRTMHRIRDGLANLGPSVGFQWRPNVGLEMPVARPVSPFAQARLSLLPLPREVLPLWLFDRFVRGRRDRLVLRAEFAQAPAAELLVADPGIDLGKLALDTAASKGISSEHLRGSGGHVMAYAGGDAERARLARDLARTVLEQDWPLRVVSYHKHRPHLVAVWEIDRLDSNLMSRMLKRLRRLGQEVLKESGAPPS